MAYHATNREAIHSIQTLGDLEQASRLFLEAVKTIKSMLYVQKKEVSVAMERVEKQCPTSNEQNLKLDIAHVHFRQETQDQGEAAVPITPPTLVNSTNSSLAAAARAAVSLFYMVPLLPTRAGESFSSDHLSTSPSSTTPLRFDAVGECLDRVFTFAFVTIPKSFDDPICCANNTIDEDEWISYISTVLGALLYNTALSFHLSWLQGGRSSNIMKALKFYRAARAVLQANVPLAAFTAKRETSVLRCKTTTDAGTVLLAVLNNLFAIHYELAEIELVDKIRSEMRQTTQYIDPELSFASNEEAYALSCINAFFYTDNADMKVARAA